MFEYQPGRDGQSPKRLLKDYRGYLQADGYSVYEWFDTQSGITLMQCMAHARREFTQALDNDRPRAAYVLSQFGKLYDIERKAREQNMTDAQRLALRQQHAVDILTDMGEWLKKEIGQVLPKSLISKAIAYALARWDKLCLYVEDGMLEIDNNLVENAIRALALGVTICLPAHMRPHSALPCSILFSAHVPGTK